MAVQNINTSDYKDLYMQYDWFQKTFAPVIQQTFDEFFGEGFKFELLGASKNVNSLMDKDAYFVTKVRIDKQHDIFFRISERGIGIILDNALGKAGKRFNLNKMTDLEAKIITGVNDKLYGAVAPLLIKAPPTLKRTNFDIIHLTYLIKDIEENTVSKFIISLPEVLLEPEAVVSSGEKFSSMDFPQSMIEVSLLIGTTKFSLLDVKNLDVEDIVVLDESDASVMTLKFKDYEKEINLRPNLGLVLPFDNNGGNNMTSADNLWDSIEVEMSAQFDAVKITLGELKSIEEGQVVDLTSIYDNKVTLSVENKAIATGELVIINDRYGVKVTEIIANSGQAGSASAPTQQAGDDFEYGSEEFDAQEFGTEDFAQEGTEGFEQAPAQQYAPAEPGGEEEFDYSDFELEDEDI